MRKQRRKCVPQHKKTKTVCAVVEKAVADKKHNIRNSARNPNPDICNMKKPKY